ncbi:MAG: ABC transporter substrate-binding protein [Chthoniobacterales bacterium]|jgi:iron complex transport system substrate-binding protein
MKGLRTSILILCLTSHGFAGEAPGRVVSLAPSTTQMVRSAGAGSRLAGVTPFCDAPAGIPRVPGGVLADSEAVLGLDPDLVLCTSMTPASTRRQLAALGLPVEVIETPSLEAIREETRRVAGLVGAERPSTEPPPSPSPDGRTAALLFGADTGYSAGCGSHAHEILEAAGLRNIAAEASGPWPQLGEEFLLEKDPEIIIIAEYGETTRGEILAKLRAHPVRRLLRAVQSGKVIVFPAAALTVPGPGALAAVPELRDSVKQP